MLSPIRFIADKNGGYTSDAGEVMIDAAGAGSAVTIDADHNQFVGFTITGSSPGVPAGGGIHVTANAQGTVIRGCELYGNERGVYLGATDDVTIESNVISNHFGGDALGIWIDGATNVLALNNLIYNNGGSGTVVSGGATGVDIESCTYFGNGGDQILSLIHI